MYLRLPATLKISGGARQQAIVPASPSSSAGSFQLPAAEKARRSARQAAPKRASQVPDLTSCNAMKACLQAQKRKSLQLRGRALMEAGWR